MSLVSLPSVACSDRCVLLPPLPSPPPLVHHLTALSHMAVAFVGVQFFFFIFFIFLFAVDLVYSLSLWLQFVSVLSLFHTRTSTLGVCPPAVSFLSLPAVSRRYRRRSRLCWLLENAVRQLLLYDEPNEQNLRTRKQAHKRTDTVSSVCTHHTAVCTAACKYANTYYSCTRYE